MTIKLYCFGESGNAYKAALTLQLARLDWSPIYVDFFGGETRSERFRSEINSMGEVPTLMDGETTLSQSGAIQHYLCDTYAPDFGTRHDHKNEVLRWVLWDNHKLSSQAGVARFLQNFVPEEKRPEPVITFLKGRLNAAFKILDAHLADREWIADKTPTIADFSCCGYLFYPEPYGFVRKDWKHIDRWLSRIQELPDWKHPYDLMPGNPADRA